MVATKKKLKTITSLESDIEKLKQHQKNNRQWEEDLLAEEEKYKKKTSHTNSEVIAHHSRLDALKYSVPSNTKSNATAIQEKSEKVKKFKGAVDNKMVKLTGEKHGAKFGGIEADKRAQKVIADKLAQVK